MVSIAIDSSLIFQLVNFLLMIIVMNYLLYKPIRGIIKERHDKIKGYESDIDRLIRQTKNRGQEIEAKLVQARRDGYSAREQIKEEGLEQERSILDEAGQKAGEAIDEVRTQVSAEIGVARESLRSDLDIFAADLAEKILGRNLS